MVMARIDIQSALQHLAADGRTAPELQAKSRHLHLGSLGRYVQLGEQASAFQLPPGGLRPGFPSKRGHFDLTDRACPRFVIAAM